MIGAPIRNEKRAASACLSPATTPATIVEPEREIPGIRAKHLGEADRQRALPVELIERPDRFFADPVAEIEDEAVDDQEDCGDRRRGESVAEELAEQGADDDRRDGRQHDEEERPSCPSARGLPTRRQGRAQKFSQSRQKKAKSAIEVPKCMTDQIGEPVRGLLVDSPIQTAAAGSPRGRGC